MTEDINYHLQLLFPYHITGILLWVHDEKYFFLTRQHQFANTTNSIKTV